MFSGKRLVPFQEFAPEAQMTLNSIHRDHPVQKAGQAPAAALALQPLPRILIAPVAQALLPVRPTTAAHVPEKTKNLSFRGPFLREEPAFSWTFRQSCSQAPNWIRRIRLCLGATQAAPHLGTQRESAPAPHVTDDAVRVAGGIASSQKRSTAALASFRFGDFPNQRRAPRHPSSGTGTPACAAGNSLRQGTASAVPSQTPSFGASAPEELRCNLHHQFTNQEDTMHAITPRRSFTTIIPVIFRITLSLLLWTLGASAMDLRIAPVQPKDHRIVLTFPIDRSKVEALQRWVNAGHDSWCRDPQAVAAATLRRVSPDLAEFEPTALSLELESTQKTKAVYTFHSLDGTSTYRVTLRRFRFLLSTSGSLRQTIWTPESVEILTRDSRE